MWKEDKIERTSQEVSNYYCSKNRMIRFTLVIDFSLAMKTIGDKRAVEEWRQGYQRTFYCNSPGYRSRMKTWIRTIGMQPKRIRRI